MLGLCRRLENRCVFGCSSLEKSKEVLMRVKTVQFVMNKDCLRDERRDRLRER